MENIFKSIILGIVQGVAEFLPISSSGHLIVFRKFMHLELPLIFDIYLHLATVLVVFIYYRKKIIELILTLVKFVSRRTSKSDSENLKLISILLIITFITGSIGIFIEKYEESFAFNLVLLNFVVTGILLLILELKPFNFNLQNNIFASGMFVGIMQGIGALPGISRSGITIFSTILLGFSRTKASEISFLALIPVVLGGFLLKYKELSNSHMAFSMFEVNIGAITAFAVGLVSINLLMNIIKNQKLYYFSIYLFALSSVLYFFF